MKNIMDIVIIILQSFSGVYVLSQIINIDIRKNKNKIIISFIIFMILMFLSKIVIPNHMRSIFSILVLTALTFYICKSSLIESLIVALITVAMTAIIEVVFSLILTLLGASQKQLIEVPFWNILANILISVTTIMIISIKKVNNMLVKFKNTLTKRKKVLFCFMIIFLFIYLVVAKNSLFSKMTLEMIINLVILCFAIALFIIIFLSDNKNKILEEINKQMLDHVTKYEKIITDQGKANHEFKNQLMVIRGYAQMNSPKLIEYLDSVIEDSKKTHSSYLISQLNKFPAGGIKGLLYYKLSTMDDENIKHELNVESGVKIRLDTLGTESYKNITKVLGVLFDNAIDACKKSKDKKIIIDVVKKTNLVTFSIYNTYKGKIDIDQIGTGFTTKGSGHGYGLRLVKDIIESSNIFEIENDLEDEYYVTKLTIKTKNKQTKKKK